MSTYGFSAMPDAEREKYATYAAQTTAQTPWPVRLLSENVERYISKMPALWVEGQVVELKVRPGAKIQFLTLRDPEVEASFTLKIWTNLLPEKIKEGDRVVVYCKPDFYIGNGSLSLLAKEMQILGIGDLLTKIELLRKQLASEGLFAPERKKPLPFLPRKIGLICGRAAKAQADVIENVERRWPGMKFEIREVAVQGAECVPSICAALAEIDARDDIDIIVITRGGGSVEDLLPFSSETLVRAVASCRLPVVSAIGHEEDCPLLDNVADYRASTPTDAAKRIVPDHQLEIDTITQGVTRLRNNLKHKLQMENSFLAQLTNRAIFTNPTVLYDKHILLLQQNITKLHQTWADILEYHNRYLATKYASLRALSPSHTLERGYTILRDKDKKVITNATQVAPTQRLEAILASGRLGLEVFAQKIQD